MDGRRFAARCEAQLSSLERADNLREVSRLASSITLPYAVTADYTAQIKNFARAEENLRAKQKRAMLDSWANLIGPLGHLRSWAQGRPMVPEQQNG